MYNVSFPIYVSSINIAFILRSLLIPLMMAERAWGYAMQLRQEANTEPRKKFHLVSRMRKAATHALALEEICTNANCDPRTKLEAQAYVAWIHGSLHFELQLWKTAMEHLKKAQYVLKDFNLIFKLCAMFRKMFFVFF